MFAESDDDRSCHGTDHVLPKRGRTLIENRIQSSVKAVAACPGTATAEDVEPAVALEILTLGAMRKNHPFPMQDIRSHVKDWASFFLLKSLREHKAMLTYIVDVGERIFGRQSP